jgi:hypothetical protein
LGPEQDKRAALARGPAALTTLSGDVTPVQGDSLAIATSGTVTITSIGADSITGTFDVTMGGPYGQTDRGARSAPSHLGAFRRPREQPSTRIGPTNGGGRRVFGVAPANAFGAFLNANRSRVPSSMRA